jgi:hypothetical protein
VNDDELNALSEEERQRYREVLYRPVVEFLIYEMGMTRARVESILTYDARWFNDTCFGFNLEELMKLYMKDRHY